MNVVYYWNLHSPPHGLNGAIKIINELDPDMIWYAHRVTGIPMPPDINSAYDIAKNCGLSEKKAKEFQQWCKQQAYTLEHVKEQVDAVKDKIYCPCILGYSNFRIDFNFDPITFECIDRDTMWNEMLLNFGKWGIVNPRTGKPYTVRETQELFWRRGLPRHNGIPDFSNPLVQEYYIKKAQAMRDCGAKAVWFDMFFQLPQRLMDLLNLDYNHPMIRDLYMGCVKIMNTAKFLGLTVGTWINALMFPYNVDLYVDFYNASPTTQEVKTNTINKRRWKTFADLVKTKATNRHAWLLIMFDFGARCDLPLPTFACKSVPEQNEFLIKLYMLSNDLRDYGIEANVAYPIHGPGLCERPCKRAWGRYDYYDALAPEFFTYPTIKAILTKRLLIKAVTGNKPIKVKI